MNVPTINTNFAKKFGNNRWSSYSIKLQRTVYMASDLEYDHWLCVECNPNIINFCEQPFEIKQMINQKRYASIPDMWILYADGTEEIREVKYERDRMNEKVQRQIKIQQTYCKEKGLIHRLITDNQIRANNYLLSNYKTIIQLLKNETSLDKHIQNLLIKCVDAHPLSIEEISLKLAVPLHNLIPNIALLLFNGVILADLEHTFFGNKLEVYLK